MLPTLEGIIARRVLLNFRADPEVARRLVPEPLEVATQNGQAAVGVCLIRLEQLRPKGLPASVGMSSENMAHRIAIRYPAGQRKKDGVFIWRRETDHALVTLLGGRLFPGVHRRAQFRVTEHERGLAMDVRTEDNQANVWFGAQRVAGWQSTPLFQSFDEACGFFQRGDCGFSCSLHDEKLEGMQLRALKWEMHPLEVHGLHAAFYENRDRFPRGSVEFDCGLLMLGVPHEWHELDEVPELAGTLSR